MKKILKNIMRVIVRSAIFIYCKIVYRVKIEGKENVPKDELETVYEIVKNKMENVVELHVPLIVDINYGKNWYECDK